MKDYPKYGNRHSQSLVRKKTAIAKRSSLKLALLWIVMVVVALFFVQQRINYIRTEKRVRRLLADKEEIQLSILPLKLEARYLTQQDKIEQVARTQFNLQIPRAVQVVPVQVDQNRNESEELEQNP